MVCVYMYVCVCARFTTHRPLDCRVSVEDGIQGGVDWQGKDNCPDVHAPWDCHTRQGHESYNLKSRIRTWCIIIALYIPELTVISTSHDKVCTNVKRPTITPWLSMLDFGLTHNVERYPTAEVCGNNESHSLEHSILLFLLHHPLLDSPVYYQVGNKDEEERGEIEDMKDRHGVLPARCGFVCDVQRNAHSRTGVEFSVEVAARNKRYQGDYYSQRPDHRQDVASSLYTEPNGREGPHDCSQSICRDCDQSENRGLAGDRGHDTQHCTPTTVSPPDGVINVSAPVVRVYGGNTNHVDAHEKVSHAEVLHQVGGHSAFTF